MERETRPQPHVVEAEKVQDEDYAWAIDSNYDEPADLADRAYEEWRDEERAREGLKR